MNSKREFETKKFKAWLGSIRDGVVFFQYNFLTEVVLVFSVAGVVRCQDLHILQSF